MQSNTRDDLSIIRSFCSPPPPPTSSSVSIIDCDVSYFQDDVMTTTSDHHHHHHHRPAVSSVDKSSKPKDNSLTSSLNSPSRHHHNPIQNHNTNSSSHQQRGPLSLPPPLQQSFDYLHEIVRGGNNSSNNNNNNTTISSHNNSMTMISTTSQEDNDDEGYKDANVDGGDNNNNDDDDAFIVGDPARSATFRLDVSVSAGTTNGSLFFSTGEKQRRQPNDDNNSKEDEEEVYEDVNHDINNTKNGDVNVGDCYNLDDPTDDLLLRACDTATSACGGDATATTSPSAMADATNNPLTPAPFSRLGDRHHFINADINTAANNPTTTTPWTEARSFVNGLLSPFSPLLKQPNSGDDSIADVMNNGEHVVGDPQRVRNEYLQYVSLKPCRKVSVVVRVLPVPNDGGENDDSSHQQTQPQQQQRCVFPHYKEDRATFLTPPTGRNDHDNSNSINNNMSSPTFARFVSPPQHHQQHQEQQQSGNSLRNEAMISQQKKTPALRDMVVVNPSAFGKYIPSQVTMETARLVAQVAQINTEDWARLYEYHHVMWPTTETTTNSTQNTDRSGPGVAPRSFDTMDSLSRAAAQDAVIENESSLLISLGKEASCIGNQENGLWPKILTHCQAIMETQAVITLSMVEVLENKPDSFRDLLLPHQNGGSTTTTTTTTTATSSDTSSRTTITLRHNDMKGAVLEGLVQVSIDSMPALLESLYRRRRRKSSKSSPNNGGGTTAVIGILNFWKDAVSHELNKAPNSQITCVELATSGLAVGTSGGNNESIVQRKCTVSLGQALRQLLLHERAIASKMVSVGAIGTTSSGITTPASAIKATTADGASMLLPTTSYRETTLTKVLQRSMESSKIVVVGSISPLSIDHDQTVAILNYLRRLLAPPGQTASSPFPHINARAEYLGHTATTTSATTTPQPLGTKVGSLTASPLASTTTTTTSPTRRRRTSPQENEQLQLLARSKGMLENLVSDPRQRLAKLLKTSPPRKLVGPHTSLEFQRSFDDDDEEEDVEPINYMQGMHTVRVMDVSQPTTNSMSWEKHYPQPQAQEPSFDDDDLNDPGANDRLESRGDATPKLIESPGTGQGRHLWYNDDEEEVIHDANPKDRQNDGWYSEEEIERALEEEIQGVGRLYPEDDFSDEEVKNKVCNDDSRSNQLVGGFDQIQNVVVDQLKNEQGSDDTDNSDSNQIIEERWSYDLEPPQPASVDASGDGQPELVQLEFQGDDEEGTTNAFVKSIGNEDKDGFPELVERRTDSTFSRVIDDHLEAEFYDYFAEGRGHPVAKLNLHNNDGGDGDFEVDHFSSEARTKENIQRMEGTEDDDGDLQVIEFFDQDEEYLDQRGNNGDDHSLAELDPIDYDDSDGAHALLDLPQLEYLDDKNERNPVDDGSFPGHFGGDDISLELDNGQRIRTDLNSPSKNHTVSSRSCLASGETSFVHSDPDNTEHSGENDEPQTDYELPEAPIPFNGSMDSSRRYSNASPPIIIDDRRIQAGIRLPSPYRDRSAFSNFSSPYSSRHNLTAMKEISVLAAEREELHSTVETLKDNLRKVTEDHDGHMQQYEEEVQQLYGKLDAAMDDKRSFERVAKEALDAQTSQLEEMRALATEREELRLTVETLKENLAKVSNNHEEHLQRYQHEVDHLHSKLGKTVKAQRALEKIADEAVAAHRSQVEDTRLLAAERDELHFMVESLQENVKGLSGDHTTHVKKYQEEIRVLRKKLEESFEDRRAVQTTADEARFAYESQSEQIRTVSSERDELRSMLNSMKGSMKKVTGDYNDQLERYKEEVRQLHSKLDGALCEKLAVEKVSDEARFANSDLERKVKNLEDELVASRLRAANIDDLRLTTEQKLVDHETASLRMKETIDELESERDLLRKQKRDDEATMKRLEAELKRQKTSAEHVESSHARLESLRLEDQETIQKLRDEIRTKDSDRFGVEHLQHELTRLKRDKDYLQKIVENRKAEYTEILREREDELVEFKSKHAEVQKELELSIANLASISRTKEAIESQVKLGQDNISKLSRQVLARDESIDRLESSLVQLQTLRKEDQNTIRQLNAELRIKETEQLDLEHLQNELSRLKSDKDHLETLNEHRKAELMDAIVDREDQILDYKSKVEGLEVELLASRVALTTTEQQKLDSNKQVKGLQEMVSKLTREVRTRDESVDRLMSELAQVEVIRKEDQETIRDLTGQLRNKESEQVALDQLHHKLSRLKQDKDHLGRLMETRKVEYETFMRERANEVAEYRTQSNALQLQLEKARSDGAKIINDAEAQLKALRDVESNLVQNLDDRDRTIEALQLDLLKFKEEMTAIRQREKSISGRADREIDNLKKQVSNLEAEYTSTKRNADEATNEALTEALAHKTTRAELDRAKEEVQRHKVALGRLNEELDSRQRHSLRSEEKIFNMEATLRRFQEETKSKVGQLMGRHKDSASVLGEARNENRMLSNEMVYLEKMVEQLRAERDACYESLQIGRAKMADLMLKNNIHEIGSLFDVTPPMEERSYRKLAPPPPPSASRRFVAPEIYITDYSIDRALSVRAEEIAACVAVSAKNSIQESQDEASQLRSQIYRMEEEKTSEVVALKTKVRNLEQELARQEIQDKYHFSNSGRRKQRYSYLLDPAE
jgi:chromosome segregation ATPase